MKAFVTPRSDEGVVAVSNAELIAPPAGRITAVASTTMLSAPVIVAASGPPIVPSAFDVIATSSIVAPPEATRGARSVTVPAAAALPVGTETSMTLPASRMSRASAAWSAVSPDTPSTTSPPCASVPYAVARVAVAFASSRAVAPSAIRPLSVAPAFAAKSSMRPPFAPDASIVPSMSMLPSSAERLTRFARSVASASSERSPSRTRTDTASVKPPAWRRAASVERSARLSASSANRPLRGAMVAVPVAAPRSVPSNCTLPATADTTNCPASAPDADTSTTLSAWVRTPPSAVASRTMPAGAETVTVSKVFVNPVASMRLPASSSIDRTIAPSASSVSAPVARSVTSPPASWMRPPWTTRPPSSTTRAPKSDAAVVGAAPSAAVVSVPVAATVTSAPVAAVMRPAESSRSPRNSCVPAPATRSAFVADSAVSSNPATTKRLAAVVPSSVIVPAVIASTPPAGFAAARRASAFTASWLPSATVPAVSASDGSTPIGREPGEAGRVDLERCETRAAEGRGAVRVHRAVALQPQRRETAERVEARLRQPARRPRRPAHRRTRSRTPRSRARRGRWRMRSRARRRCACRRSHPR